jgi:hypothetical protein
MAFFKHKMQSHVVCCGRPVTRKQMKTQHEKLKSMVFEWFCKEAAMPVEQPMITTCQLKDSELSMLARQLYCFKGSGGGGH